MDPIELLNMGNPEYGEQEFLCYQVLKEMRQQFGRDMPKTEFYKLCYIVNEELLDKGVDVELPVHWYRYGGVLTTQAMNAGFYNLEEKRWSSNRGNNVVLNDEVSEDDFEVSDEKKAEIVDIASETVREFGNIYGTKKKKDYQYDHYAPNEFVRILDKYREYLDDMEELDRIDSDSYVSNVDVSFNDIVSSPSSSIDNSSQDTSEQKEEIRGYLDKLAKVYPEELYEGMYPLFLEWESLSRQLIKNGNFSQLFNFTEDFWKTFSRVELRLKHERNTPNLKKRKWARKKKTEKEDFKEEIEKYRAVVLQNREQTSKLHTVADSYSETVRDLFEELSQ